MFHRNLPVRARVRIGAVLIATSMPLVAATCAHAQVTTTPRGSTLRAAILDGLRPMVEAEVGARVEFVVDGPRVPGEWAFALVTPQRPGRGPIHW